MRAYIVDQRVRGRWIFGLLQDLASVHFQYLNQLTQLVPLTALSLAEFSIFNC